MAHGWRKLVRNSIYLCYRRHSGLGGRFGERHPVSRAQDIKATSGERRITIANVDPVRKHQEPSPPPFRRSLNRLPPQL
jgi:hypothetical protein